ncbi:DUF945 family protein [Sulfurimonas sp.]|uniref:DUF945 family protein n=1 Tax=Sulfurimonas sp. TaxID=2022749 RepID=UPI003567131A
MKKLLVIVLIIIATIAALPFLGNQIIESELKSNIEFLTSNGIEVNDKGSKSSYFKTSKHYELTIKNADKFSKYLAKFSDSQIPPYVTEMLEGTKLATDLKYCNMPINSEVNIEVYPLALSTSLMDEMKKNNAKFASYVKNFLQKGGLKYNINLDVRTKEFEGYIYDIDETYTTSEGLELKTALKGVTFSGKGNVFMPESIDMNMDMLSIDLNDKIENVKIVLKNISTKSTFESRTNYMSDLKFKNIVVKTTGGVKGNFDLSLDDLIVNSASNSKGQKIEILLKTKVGSLDISSTQNKVVLNKLAYDMAIKDIDKDAFEKLLDSFNKARGNNSVEIQLEIKKDMEKLVERGVTIELPEFSLKSVSYDNVKDLKGFNSNINFVLPPNVLTPKLINPIQALDKIKLDIFLKISKELFTNISSSTPMVAITKGYAKDSGEDLVYDLKLENGSLTVNGEVIR